MSMGELWRGATQMEHLEYGNFKQWEFYCPCGKCIDDIAVHHWLMRSLQVLRGAVHGPVLITSGFRCRDHNYLKGGHKNSQHMYGLAVDIVVPGWTPGGVTIKLKELRDDMEVKINEVGVYDYHVHVQVNLDDSKWTEWRGSYA